MSPFYKSIALCLFLLLWGIVPPTPRNEPELVSARQSVPALTPDQIVIVQHLAEKYSQPAELLSRIVQAAYAEGTRVGISPLTLLAIMEKESGLRPHVVNSYGAVGLMQVVPRFHRDKLSSTDAIAELQHPETNIRIGTRILAGYLTAKRGNLQQALKKYSGNARQYAQRVAEFRNKLVVVQSQGRALHSMS